MKTFQDKVAVVTGAGGTGIGNALVCALAKQGAHVAYCDIKGLEKTAQDIASYGIQSYSEHVDIGNKQAIADFAANVIQRFGKIDILINNAGISSGNITFAKLTQEDFEKITNINYWGVIHTTKAFYSHLLKRPEAAIVNMSSAFGILAMPYLVSYCTTKFAVRGFSDALRIEHYFEDINHISVHTVHPGAVATNFALHSQYQGDSTEKFHKILQKTGASPQSAAQTILKGIKKKKARIFVSNARLLDALVRILPISYAVFVRLVMKLLKAK